MKKIFSFSSNDFILGRDYDVQHLGIRGRNLMDLAVLGVPILPGFILTEEFLSEGESNPDGHDEAYAEAFEKMGKILKKKIDSSNPLLIKLVVSPMLNMVESFSSVHNVGLCDKTIAGFAEYVGENFAYHEYCGLLSRVLRLKMLASGDKNKNKLYGKLAADLKKASSVKQRKVAIDKVRSHIPNDFFGSGLFQFHYLRKLFRKLFVGSETLSDSAILVQAMTFGNYADASFFGTYTTRDIITGDKEISGYFFKNSFDDTTGTGLPLKKLDKKYLTSLRKFAKELEIKYKEIRQVKFTVESGTLWIIDQSTVPEKSARAEIKTLLDLLEQKVVDEDYIINIVQPGRLLEILHPVIDQASTAKIPSVVGGISGAVGAAVGRVYFTTENLLKAYRVAKQLDQEQRFILAMPSTYAEDVKAIEVAEGVLTRDGGYASHAPVVARSLGKIAMVNPQIEFTKTGLKIGNRTLKEGDYISLDVPSYREPTVFFGKVRLIEPDIRKGCLLDLLEVVQRRIGKFDVRANADQPKDAVLAKLFLAKGIGLCRTEHMFFDEKRIQIFRSLILASDEKSRGSILSKLKVLQSSDFYNMFKVMEGKPVTIRLLDAPLHEFLPHTKATMDKFISFLRKTHPKLTPAEIRQRCDIMSEVNPMLGHRGVRVAITYFSIYKMQVEAILEAALKIKKEKGIDVCPEIMIPVVMTPREVKTVRFGKRIEGLEIDGIRKIEDGVKKRMGVRTINYKVGTMIELPAAALLADKIAVCADFFSFGTNDLTQTCLGLSRDDFNSFFSEYNEFDLLENNPFQFLQEPVKELIHMAVERGRSVRPDLSCGLCGEHGAEPDNVAFCMEAGLDYVSCSPYGIPLAKLAIAKLNLKKKD